MTFLPKISFSHFCLLKKLYFGPTALLSRPPSYATNQLFADPHKRLLLISQQQSFMQILNPDIELCFLISRKTNHFYEELKIVMQLIVSLVCLVFSVQQPNWKLVGQPQCCPSVFCAYCLHDIVTFFVFLALYFYICVFVFLYFCIFVFFYLYYPSDWSAYGGLAASVQCLPSGCPEYISDMSDTMLYKSLISLTYIYCISCLKHHICKHIQYT